MVFAKVVFDYVADQEDELSLNVGDIVTNIEIQDGGWWEGEVDGKKGMFPENFVEVIKEEPVKSPPANVTIPPPSLPEPTKPTAQASTKRHARVTFQYDPEQADELALEVGDIIEILEEEDEGWWKGKLGEKVGMFPSNFAELIKDEPSFKPAALPEPLEPVLAPSATAADSGIKNNRPKSQIGFGISLGDLNRDKLKKTGKAPPKKADETPPKEPVEKKSPAPPVPTVPKEMITRTVQKAKVTFAYVPEQEDELKLNVGEILVITNKEIFDGWMQGELNGKTGLFPDNFVELLPLENIRVESGNDAPKRDMKKSVRRAAKQNPAPERSEPPTPEKPKQFGALFPPGANLKQELEKKLAGGGKPPPPGTQKPKVNKPPPPGPPAKPTKPKPPVQSKPSPPTPNKHEVAPSVPEFPRTASLSRKENKVQPPSRSNSESLPRNKVPPKPAPPVNPPQKMEQDLAVKDIKEETVAIDLDQVKSTDPLKHIQRAKPPSKNPPSKFKGAGGVDSKEVEELKSQVSELQDKMSDMEKKFKKLFNQVQDELDSSRKERMNQQIEIDRLKRQIELI